tara:strand:+ start:2662 stop:2832 length:171 start_codon:yes stop_codon:yes gene_type:complete
MSNTIDLVNQLKVGNNVDAEKSFSSIITDKVDAALEARKIQVASQLVQRNSQSEEE